MIKGLFEAHLPVSNLVNSISFYTELGLQMAYRDKETAFFWIEKGKSWLGLWEGKEVNTPYHPSMRHIAFRIDYEDMKKALGWMKDRGIEPSLFGGRPTTDPFVRLHQGNASVYFNDPDGNSLEFMCHIDIPEEMKQVKSISLEEYEEMIHCK